MDGASLSLSFWEVIRQSFFNLKVYFKAGTKFSQNVVVEAFLQHLLSMDSFHATSESAVNLTFEPKFACFSTYNAFLSRLTRYEETDRPGEGGT